jgi:excinuclease ABC subunit A
MSRTSGKAVSGSDSAPFIVARGVRVHNLKNVDVSIPRNHLTVVSGVSGSGKSSLAFDTLYAEGRRRYVECLSTYTRQFLERMDRPEAETLDALPPAIAIKRAPPARQARSTVGTLSEIHDYFRLLFARVGTLRCLGCDREVRIDTVETVTDETIAAGGKAVVTFRIPAAEGGAAWIETRERLRREGFLRVWTARGAKSIDDASPGGPSVEVVVDRLAPSERSRSRVADAVDVAYAFGGGRCVVHRAGGGERHYSRSLHCPDCDRDYRPPEPNLFSPNSPLGACPDCQGFGRVIERDMEKVIPDRGRTLAEKPVDAWNTPAYRGAYRDLRRAGKKIDLRWDVPYGELSRRHRDLVEHGGHGFYGIDGFFKWLEGRTYRVHVRVFLARFRAYRTCRTCDGKRLRPDALAVSVDGNDIATVMAWPIASTRRWVDGLSLSGENVKIASPVLAELRRRVRFLDDVGAGYLTLDRASRTLSGGENQRIQLARCLGTGLVNTLYVLDEPTVGLHPLDVDRLLEAMLRIRDLGNTLVVVEHDPRVIRAADYLVDLGPGAGEHGGEVIFQGPARGVARARGSLTGDYLSGRRKVGVRATGRKPGHDGFITLLGVTTHNLREIDVRIPRACMTVVTGVSGSGKSSLVENTLLEALREQLESRPPETARFRELHGTDGIASVEAVDQSPIGKTPRSNPVTYVKAFDGIRKRLAATSRARSEGMTPGFFSFNVPGGRCDKCEGTGAQTVEMHFLPDIVIPCEACEGARFGPAAMAVRHRGYNVADILAMTVDEARRTFDDVPEVAGRLAVLSETGLGYVRLGQPASTLSGGESQRLKLAAHLGVRSKGARVFLLDEPTTGLHLHDLDVLLRVLQRLVNAGHTVVVVEHHLAVIRAADWVIDLGPGGGPDGGRLVAEGPPEVVARSSGPTGRYLSGSLGKTPRLHRPSSSGR